MDQPTTERAGDFEALRRRTIVLVGLMGAGKTSVGKRLAAALDLAFKDSDEEIEQAAGLTIPEIFQLYGEREFREGERRVMARLLTEPPHILATGGGAFLSPDTRTLIKRHGVSVWLKADLDVLVRRVGRKDNRPLLAGSDPREVLQRLADLRNPIYALADVTVETGDKPHHATVEAVLSALRAHLAQDAA